MGCDMTGFEEWVGQKSKASSMFFFFQVSYVVYTCL